MSVRLGNASGLVRPDDPCHPLAAGAGFRLFLYSSSHPCGPKWLTARKLSRRPWPATPIEGWSKTAAGRKKGNSRRSSSWPSGPFCLDGPQAGPPRPDRTPGSRASGAADVGPLEATRSVDSLRRADERRLGPDYSWAHNNPKRKRGWLRDLPSLTLRVSIARWTAAGTPQRAFPTGSGGRLAYGLPLGLSSDSIAARICSGSATPSAKGRYAL